MGKDKDDEAIPRHITSDHSSIQYSTEYEDPEDLGSFPEEDLDYFENADTDVVPIDTIRRPLVVVTFRLFNIASNHAPCFFCGRASCDLTFVSKSHLSRRTKAYAVHSGCVSDHEELQALGDAPVS